ncbi:KEOPS complex subunit Pcc1 [Methanotorris igneus]|nr:KEOPS complex subunit Pcc1 [Methanotorris igneus]
MKILKWEKMSKINSFCLEIEFDSPEEAEVIYKAILLDHLESQIKSKADMQLNANILNIQIFAEDLSILRAALYSYLRWIKVSDNIYKICKG